MEEYSEIINWMDCELSSLPFLAEINDDEIKSQTGSDSNPDWNIIFKQIPVLMQAVEKCVNSSRKPQEKIVVLNFEVDL